MNRQASVFNVLMQHEQNRKIRRAIVASGGFREMDQMRRVFSTLLNSSKVASVDATFLENNHNFRRSYLLTSI
jgi:activator of 2-hydroxyglutaryl-CoA dehydratase